MTYTQLSPNTVNLKISSVFPSFSSPTDKNRKWKLGADGVARAGGDIRFKISEIFLFQIIKMTLYAMAGD